ncbi:hypothetical protein LTR04_005378 [Oleoguttula sp. CCFEE 6159]|nr:hypothetical protein LTR04_005378 [Oleoguttula sp. CCFEE 6159]
MGKPFQSRGAVPIRPWRALLWSHVLDPAHDLSFDLRPIDTIVQLLIHQTDSRARVTFLVHKPPTGVVAADLVIELGVDIIEGPDSLVKRNDPFGETNVKGVFVAGDAGTLLKQIMGHMAQGATADAVIHIQLCQQEIERVMANLKSMEVEDVKVKEMEKEPEVLFK